VNEEEYLLYRSRPLRTRPRAKTQFEAVRTIANVVSVVLQIVILARIFGLI